jgi:hypothetical protein
MSCKRGQNMMEFAIILMVVSAAIAAMSVYGKRAIQGSVKTLSDQLGTQTSQGADDKAVTVTHSESESMSSGDTNIQDAEGGSRLKTIDSSDHSWGNSASVTVEEL